MKRNAGTADEISNLVQSFGEWMKLRSLGEVLDHMHEIDELPAQQRRATLAPVTVAGTGNFAM
ncbi:hypothetical protein IVB33_15585 [Bradyrhizobium sp. 24]|uniref:hypothetical protein n=1 Tax=unclassified Bradyrhizobium TaxID=2631580 RepID=UPI001FF99707|nr:MULTISPECIES: hypothetical protein [unclassified Bradyrhizobium]MCK1302061.1 hypothetical protein [Bradyrhizobium sp. 37]MCK1379147.1 hypothetical protein [Bradyrhizobium sp. 24]MCK1774245.1 hypothetical protein [Bradyrhizobium sp. 134]